MTLLFTSSKDNGKEEFDFSKVYLSLVN